MQRSIVNVLGKAGDKANAAASTIARCFRKASALFRRSTAFRNEIFRAQREVLDVPLGEEMTMTVPNDTRWNGIHECVSRWNQIMPGALDVFKKHAAQVKKPASLLTEDEEEDDDGDDEPPPLMSGSESESDSEDDDDDDSASSEDDTPVAPKKKSKAEISFAQRVQNVAISDDVWRAGRDLEAVLDAPREMTTLVQTTSQASLSLTLPLARQIINKCGADMVAVPVWRKVSTPTIGSVEELALDKYLAAPWASDSYS